MNQEADNTQNSLQKTMTKLNQLVNQKTGGHSKIFFKKISVLYYNICYYRFLCYILYVKKIL
jgi:hypothetical protein